MPHGCAVLVESEWIEAELEHELDGARVASPAGFRQQAAVLGRQARKQIRVFAQQRMGVGCITLGKSSEKTLSRGCKAA